MIFVILDKPAYDIMNDIKKRDDLFKLFKFNLVLVSLRNQKKSLMSNVKGTLLYYNNLLFINCLIKKFILLYLRRLLNQKVVVR